VKQYKPSETLRSIAFAIQCNDENDQHHLHGLVFLYTIILHHQGPGY